MWCSPRKPWRSCNKVPAKPIGRWTTCTTFVGPSLISKTAGKFPYRSWSKSDTLTSQYITMTTLQKRPSAEKGLLQRHVTMCYLQSCFHSHHTIASHMVNNINSQYFNLRLQLRWIRAACWGKKDAPKQLHGNGLRNDKEGTHEGLNFEDYQRHPHHVRLSGMAL